MAFELRKNRSAEDLPWLHVGEPAGGAVREMVAKGTPIFSTFAGTKVGVRSQ